MFSAIKAIGAKFAISQSHNSSFSMMQNSDSMRSSANGSGGDDEVSYAALNDSGADMSIDMMKDSLNYEFYKKQEEQDKQNK